ncbi:hypothetical protein GCM10022258_33090 [Aquimarina gracilis]
MLCNVRLGFTQEECGAEPPKDYGNFMLKRLASISNAKALATPVSLPIQHHVSRKSNGSSPSVSATEIQNVMDELNATYASMNISFYEYGPTRFLDNNNWNPTFNKSNDSQLVQYEVSEAINIFYFTEVTSGSSTICGFAKFPGTGNRAILDASCSQNGSTSSHELGHYFSILHTHSTSDGRELVQRTNCSNAGDFFCDTPADPRLSGLVNSSCNYTGSGTDANGDQYQPDTRNVMSYTRKSCRDGGFTQQQQNAIIVSLESDRAYLLDTTTPPACTNISNFPYSESFESSFADWTNANGDDINWTRDSGGTPSNGTGPSTGQSGSYYLYTEASTNVSPPGSPNKVAILDSPCFDLSNETDLSLEFGYHMLGTDMGTLEVLISTDDGSSYSSVWSQNGNKGDTWNQATVNLATYSGAVIKIRFKGTTGSSWRSDLSIDNIKIASTTTNPPSSCNGITGFPYRKSFEPDFGSWIQETDDDINWSLESNTTPSSNTGPSGPTHGSNYIFTEASGNGTGYPNKIALLTSPCIDLTTETDAQLSFDYHMYGSNMGTLEIRASNDDGASWTTIWTKSDDQGNIWNSKTVSLSGYSGSVIKLQLKGITGSSYRSDMAIDNIDITSGSNDIIDDDIHEISLKNISVFPNPITSGFLNIKYPRTSKTDESINITITDFLGKKIDVFNSKTETITYHIGNLRKGVYFIIIEDNNQKVTHKLVKN